MVAESSNSLLGAGVLGDGLGSLGHGVLRELTRERQSDGGLNLSARERLLLVVSRELSGLGADSLEDVVDERVHDRHSSLGDSGLGVHLLQHLVDVRAVALDSAASALRRGLLAALSAFLGRSFGHCDWIGGVE